MAREFSEVLEPLSPKQKRRAMGQFLARLEDTLPPESESTHRLERRALGFGLGALAFAAVLFALSARVEALAQVGALVAFAGLIALFGPLSRLLSNLLSGKRR